MGYDMTMISPPTSIDAMQDLLRSGDYIPDRSLSTVLFLAIKMGRPILLEGEAGVGKTEIAKVLASTFVFNATKDSTCPPPSTSGTTPPR